MDITTGDYPIDCPTECTTEIPENLYVITDISKSGPTINDLGGYCTETQGVSKTGKEWWYDNNNCVVYVKSYTDSNDISCIGEYVSPVGVQVNSFDHKDGTLTPTSTNKLFDTGIRYIDSDNDPIVIVTEWNSVLNKLINVHILCDCSFDGSANEV